MRTSVRAPLCVLKAAAPPLSDRPGPTEPAAGSEAVPKPRSLSGRPVCLLWSHCTLIWLRSWVSSIPVPSSSSLPAAAAANRASQDLARCSSRAWAAWTQEGRGEEREMMQTVKGKNRQILKRILILQL